MDRQTAVRAVAGALLAGIAAEIVFDRVALGINAPLATLAALGLVTWFGRSRGPADPLDLWLPAVAVAASMGPALRTDPSVAFLDGLLAIAATMAWAVAVSGTAVTRRATLVVAELAIEAIAGVGIGAAGLLRRATGDGPLARTRSSIGRAAPALRGAIVAVPVLGVFALLLGSADAIFGHGLDVLFDQPLDLGDAVRRTTFAAVVAWLVGGAIALASGIARPVLGVAPSAGDTAAGDTAAGDTAAGAAAARGGGAVEPAATSGGRGWTTEVLVVVGAVDVLFGVFAAVQVIFLFGGADTLATIGMTYSDYARQGYFQLVAVVTLAGLLLAVASAVSDRSRPFVTVAVALMILTGVILASAALRLRLYQGAYGWTELRFFVAASIGWLAACVAIAIVCLWRNRMAWLPHGIVVAAIVVTLAVSAIGPQAFVLQQNLARLRDPSLVAPGGFSGFDETYGLTLGDDAVPALVASLDVLTPVQRSVVLTVLRSRRDELAADAATRGPFAWNLSREQARAALAGLPDR